MLAAKTLESALITATIKNGKSQNRVSTKLIKTAFAQELFV